MPSDVVPADVIVVHLTTKTLHAVVDLAVRTCGERGWPHKRWCARESLNIIIDSQTYIYMLDQWQ